MLLRFLAGIYNSLHKRTSNFIDIRSWNILWIYWILNLLFNYIIWRFIIFNCRGFSIRYFSIGASKVRSSRSRGPFRHVLLEKPDSAMRQVMPNILISDPLRLQNRCLIFFYATLYHLKCAFFWGLSFVPLGFHLLFGYSLCPSQCWVIICGVNHYLVNRSIGCEATPYNWYAHFLFLFKSDASF